MQVCHSLIKNSDFRGKATLDFACGEGLTIKELISSGASKVMGIDADQEMLGMICKELGAVLAKE
jgi:2-polyprenyl-3-methyl-5-hydroxy-6-metoxy-1,4-benzoquinol methylase